MRGMYLPTAAVRGVADDVAELKRRVEAGAQAQVEHTVKMRGALLIVGAVSAIGLVVVLSHMADP
jgi:hypothetical protein